mmetsp:Transcript_1255/g.2688  ORF Transcript_1255/g.2688 Transcript_1255/m.2688 type:complete len:245 (-) Transcript_1255:717-1451(-)
MQHRQQRPPTETSKRVAPPAANANNKSGFMNQATMRSDQLHMLVFFTRTAERPPFENAEFRVFDPVTVKAIIFRRRTPQSTLHNSLPAPAPQHKLTLDMPLVAESGLIVTSVPVFFSTKLSRLLLKVPSNAIRSFGTVRSKPCPTRSNLIIMSNIRGSGALVDVVVPVDSKVVLVPQYSLIQHVRRHFLDMYCSCPAITPGQNALYNWQRASFSSTQPSTTDIWFVTCGHFPQVTPQKYCMSRP